MSRANHRHISDLTNEEMLLLSKQIVLNSSYFDNYENTLGVDVREAKDWFDGYMIDVYERAVEDGVTDEEFEKNFYDVIDKYDTDDFLIDRFEDWQASLNYAAYA